MTTYHPCTDILIQGLKELPGGDAVLYKWDKARAVLDKPKSEYSVIYCPSVLLLSDIKRDSKGDIVAGWVVNGAWYFRQMPHPFVREAGYIAAAYISEDSPVPVNQWTHKDSIEEIQIPGEFYGDYSYLIRVAEEFKTTGKWPAAPKKPKIDYSDMDDDIAF